MSKRRCNSGPLFFALACATLTTPAVAMSCLFQDELTYAGAKFQIQHEDNCSIPDSSLKQPLIVFAHGDGFEPADYDEFLVMLVKQGNVVVSIYGNLQSNEVRAERMLTAIDYVRNVWTHRFHLNGKIAFIGHSRGGEAVLTAARFNFEQYGQSASAVISLMATDSQEGGGEAESLFSPTSRAYLALVAERDEDVIGRCIPLIIGCKNVTSNAATLYDRVGREWGLWDVGDYLVDKTVKLLPGFSHAAWFDALDGNWANDMIGYSPSDQQKVVHDYVIRFLDWHLNGNPDQRKYFDGTTESNLLSGVVNQYVQHTTPNLVIDTFENASIQDSDWGNDLVAVNGEAAFAENSISTLDPTVPSDSHGLAIQWKNSSPSTIRWSFPVDPNIYGIPTIDVSEYAFLSLRATELYGSRLNHHVAAKARIRLVDSRNRSADVMIGMNTPFTIPKPEIQHFIGTQFGVVSTVTNMMGTLRIPVSAFANIDLSAIRSISLIVGQDSPRGAIIVDSIEFAH